MKLQLWLKRVVIQREIVKKGLRGLMENMGLMENIIQEPVTRNRYLWADLIRIIAVFAVVAIHINDFGYSLNEIPWID